MFDADDLYAEMAERRRQGVVVPYISGAGAAGFFVTRHAEAAEVLRDPSTYGTSFLSDALGPVTGGDALVGQDGDAHRSTRQLLTHALAATTWRAGHEAEVRSIADEYIGAIVQRGSGDLIVELALPFPGRVLALTLGLPEAQSPGMQAWAVQLLRNARAGTQDEAMQEVLAEQLLPSIARARLEPGDHLLGRLVGAEVGGQSLTDEMVCSLVGFLLVAGLETFHRAIGNLFFALLTHPDQLEAVRSDRSLRSRAIEETLRWESPVTLTVRNTVADTTLSATDIPAGSLLYVLLGSANRDEHRYSDPDRFEVRRPPKSHLTFGNGPHVCPGAGLSRLALGIVLDAALDATAHLRLDPAAKTPVIHGEIFRSPEMLLVECRPALSR